MCFLLLFTKTFEDSLHQIFYIQSPDIGLIHFSTQRQNPPNAQFKPPVRGFLSLARYLLAFLLFNSDDGLLE
jgi:hypothetical protein